MNNNFTIEGIDNNNKGVTGPLVYVPTEATAEFSLLQNQYNAEFGHSTGGQFNTNVRSGTNEIHGSVYEYLQNDKLNARAFFDRTGKPSLIRQNTWGWEIGGPLYIPRVIDGRNKMYVNFQGGNNRIYRVELATQKVSILITDPHLAGPTGLAVHPKSGQLIAVSWDKGKIFEISPEGALSELFSNSFFSSRFANLRGVDFDRWGNMYVSDFTTGKVWRMTWDKRFQVIAEYLPSPGDISIDRTNNLILVPYEFAHAAEMNGLETPSDGKPKQEKRTLADYGFIPPPPKPAAEGAAKK